MTGLEEATLRILPPVWTTAGLADTELGYVSLLLETNGAEISTRPARTYIHLLSSADETMVISHAKGPGPTLLMAISDDEARSLIEHLERTARETANQQDKPGIIEIINQWRVDVEAGRPVERKLKVRQSPGLDVLTGTPRSSTTSSGEFVGTEDYSPLEQLDMLVSALGLALVAPQMMARRFMDAITAFSGLGKKGQYDPVVRLVGVAETDEPEGDRPARISRASIDQSREVTGALDKLLREIVEEAELPGAGEPA